MRREKCEPPATEVRVVHSAVAQQDYLVSVAPFHYAEHPEKVWPVIYVLDANLYLAWSLTWFAP
jgi:predicted alpha/beta superfamily hydrolase